MSSNWSLGLSFNLSRALNANDSVKVERNCRISSFDAVGNERRQFLPWQVRALKGTGNFPPNKKDQIMAPAIATISRADVVVMTFTPNLEIRGCGLLRSHA